MRRGTGPVAVVVFAAATLGGEAGLLPGGRGVVGWVVAARRGGAALVRPIAWRWMVRSLKKKNGRKEDLISEFLS